MAFIGSVFSPWYRWSGRRDPENHVCINVATYGPGGRFTMTDRGRAALRRSDHSFTVGPSSLAWQDGRLVIEIDEWGAPPMVTPVCGRIVLTPAALTTASVDLTPDGAHRWRPFAPVARIDVALSQGHRWQGHGYFDANFGSRALEADFDTWTWGRYPLASGAACFYDARRRDGSRLALGLHIAPDGTATEIADAPPDTAMARTLWGIARRTRADPGTRPRQVMAMLEAPFYSRALVRTVLNGEPTTGVHEALDLRRFRGPWLMPMLAVRVPRRAGWTFPPG
ncbi:MAG: carotenoid 1,2-hydratase [Paracoccaceae bacterium]|nr:MAG: carotenoid 1,2-hydratase [Paracoccaceae bacterium]